MADTTLLALHKLLRIFLSQEKTFNKEDLDDLNHCFLFFKLLNFNYKLQVQFISKLDPKVLASLFQQDILLEEYFIELYSRIQDNVWFMNRAAHLETESKWFVIQQCKKKGLNKAFNSEDIVFEASHKEGLTILNARFKLNQKQQLEQALVDPKCSLADCLKKYLEWWVLTENIEEELAFMLKSSLKEWPDISKHNVQIFAKFFILLNYGFDLPKAFDALKLSIRSSLWQCFELCDNQEAILQEVPEKILLFLLEEYRRTGTMDADLRGFLNDLLSKQAFPRLKKIVRRYQLDFDLPQEPNIPESLQEALGNLLVS